MLASSPCQYGKIDAEFVSSATSLFGPSVFKSCVTHYSHIFPLLHTTYIPLPLHRVRVYFYAPRPSHLYLYILGIQTLPSAHKLYVSFQTLTVQCMVVKNNCHPIRTETQSSLSLHSRYSNLTVCTQALCKLSNINGAMYGGEE